MDTKQYEKNRKKLEEALLVLPKEELDFLDSLDPEGSGRVRHTERGMEFLCEGEYRKVSSSHPEEEADYIIKGLEKDKDYLLIVYTIANPLLLERLIASVSVGTYILIYEPDPYLFKYALSLYDYTFLWEANNTVILYELNNKEYQRQALKYFSCANWIHVSKNIVSIAPPNTWCYHKEKAELLSEITLKIKEFIYSLGNSMEDKLVGEENLCHNLDGMMECSPFDGISGKFKGYPAIIVASGPSLDKNIDVLCEAQDKAVILACDASVPICKSHGVKPDGIASIERDEPTYLCYYKDRTFDDDLVLLGVDLLWPKIIEEYPGKMLLANRTGRGFEQWWCKHFENIGRIGVGSSSANVAFAFADMAGCDPIILIGQDLAYTGSKKHSEETHTFVEIEGENSDWEFDGTMVEDIYGNMLRTDQYYMMFKEWFEKAIEDNPKRKVIDATEGGAKIKGADIRTLKETIDTYCTKKLPYHFYDCLPERKKPAKMEYIARCQTLIDSFGGLLEKIKVLQKEAAEHYRTLEHIYEEEKLEDMTESELIGVIKRMQAGDGIIQYLKEEEVLLTYFDQMMLQTTIAVKALGNALTIDNIRKNVLLQAKLIGVIKDGCTVLYDTYKERHRFLIEKKEAKERE
jgi:hypothetical protein